MSSPFIPCPFTYGDLPQGGQVMPMIIASRDPSNTTDVNYAPGYTWLSDLTQGGTGNLFVQEGYVAGLPNWVALSAGAAGGVNTISGVSPVGGDVDISSTPNQIIATPSLPSHEVILSLSPVLITPGSIETPSTLEVGTDLTVHGTGIFDTDVTIANDLTVTGDLIVNGAITLDALTVVGPVNLNVTGDDNTSIGNAAGLGFIDIQVPDANLTIDGNGNDILIGQDAAANHVVIGSTTGAAGTIIQAGTDDLLLTGAVTTAITIGDVAQTGLIALGISTAGQNIDIGSAVNTSAQTITLGNGASNGNTTLNMMSGIGTSGVGVIALGSNQRVTTIGIANVAPVAARVVTISGGNQAQNDTVTILGGAPSANSQIFNLLSGAASGGTQTVNLFSGNSAAATQTFNLFTGTGTGAINIGTGITGVKTIAIGGTAANVITIANAQAAGSFAVGNLMTTGTVTIGGAIGTGTITLGQATNVTGQTVSIASAASIAGPNVVSILSGATPAANQTLNIMTGVGSAGTYAVNILTGNSTGTTQTVSVATGSAVSTITIGGSGANTVNIAHTQTGGSLSLAHAMTTGNIVLGDAQTSGTLTIGSTAAGTGAVRIADGTGAQTVTIATGAGAKTITIGSLTTTSSLALQSGTGGLSLATGATIPGLISVTPSTDTQASPTAASTINSRVGTIIFTGFTTAAAGSQTWTITNSLVTTGSAIFVSISNLGANDAQMTVQRVFPAAGSFTVISKNNGAAALNGNVIVNFWVIN